MDRSNVGAQLPLGLKGTESADVGLAKVGSEQSIQVALGINGQYQWGQEGRLVRLLPRRDHDAVGDQLRRRTTTAVRRPVRSRREKRIWLNASRL